MKLWLDDFRDPAEHAHVGWEWVRTADQAIAAFQSGKVEKASLDHDLTEQQTVHGGFTGKVFDDGEKSGYDVVCWLEQNPQYLPPHGIAVHSANRAGRQRMLEVLQRLTPPVGRHP